MLGIGLGVLAVQQGVLVDDGGAGLPAGATAYADFKEGTYFYGGNALSDFLVENTAYGPFDSAAVIEGIGLDSSSPGPGDQYPVIAGPLAAAALASGFTLVMRWRNAPNCGMNVEITDLPGYTVEILARADNSGATRLAQVGGAEESLDYNVAENSLNCVAISLNDTEVAMSVNGNPTDSLTVDPGAPHDTIAIAVERGAILEDLVLYPLQANSALPSLSVP